MALGQQQQQEQHFISPHNVQEIKRRVGREGTFCQASKRFCVFSNVKFILNCLVPLWFIHNKWRHRAPTLTWFRSVPCGKVFAWIWLSFS